MAARTALKWFMETFAGPMEKAVAQTPLSVELLAAIAYQETGIVWGTRFNQIETARLLELCVGDSLDDNRGRTAFPRNRSELLRAPRGEEMFKIARAALVDMAKVVPDYRAASAMPHKFCRGFGVFQRDLQFFREDPEYFLTRKYLDFNASLSHAVAELKKALRKLGWHEKSALSDFESAAVAIAYNTGRFIPSRGLRQGYFNQQQYYGEAVFEYVREARALGGGPSRGAPDKEAKELEGASRYVVAVTDGLLNVRSEPRMSSARLANIVATLAAGQPIVIWEGQGADDFVRMQADVSGARIEGFVAAQFIEAQAAGEQTDIPLAGAATTIVEAHLRGGGRTTRRGKPGAHSLNEVGQPSRSNGSAVDRVRSLFEIVQWLAVDDPSHRRYQPASGKTYCNIYAHDLCALAGVYLPRVWWNAPSIARLMAGDAVQPLYGATVDEQRANDLNRWLRDFGTSFGWRRIATPTLLQAEVNNGAVGVISARTKVEDRSGHIAAVVPESSQYTARRDSAGNVVAPVQSQAGSANFQFGTGKPRWWLDERFAEFSFWLHD